MASRSKTGPIAEEVGTSADMDAFTLADKAEVNEDAIAAFRAGVPYWKLLIPGAAERIGRATGVDPQTIKRELAEREALVWGRANGQTFPANGDYARMRTTI